jgi:LacI family transcriptional regulator
VAKVREQSTRRVALMLATDLASSRAILRGITAYAEERRLEWIARVGPTRPETLKELIAWKPDGIIAKMYDAQSVRAVAALRIPLVNTTNIGGLPVPRVAVDDGMIGRLAAQHFLERGFRHFAFAGFAQQRSPQSRQFAYIRELKKHGFDCRSYARFDLVPLRRGETWGAIDPRFRRFLIELPRPAALFAYHDFLAWEIAQVCHSAGLRMPEDVALLGVDDDELFCRLAQPPISSIAYPAERIGYEAARMLDRMMRRRWVPRRLMLVAPSGIVVRQSSDVVATADEDLARAMRFIRANLAQPISVKSILREVPTSRRVLEEKFRRTLGRSPLREIRRMRIERAQHFLARTRMSVGEIAGRCGFSTPERFAAVFRQVTGQAPRDYRRKHGSPLAE